MENDKEASEHAASQAGALSDVVAFNFERPFVSSDDASGDIWPLIDPTAACQELKEKKSANGKGKWLG